jgi:hypothetical protein
MPVFRTLFVGAGDDDLRQDFVTVLGSAEGILSGKETASWTTKMRCGCSA